MRLFLFALFLLLLCLECKSHFAEDEAGEKRATERDSMYFAIVEDVLNGVNYFDLLNVTSDATRSQVRKAFRIIAARLHPDKYKPVDEKDYERNVNEYIVIVRASEVLADDTYRDIYERLLRDGVPWQDRVYGRYAYKHLGMKHDIRTVLAILGVLITVLEHAYRLRKHKKVLQLVKDSRRYRQHKQQVLASQGHDVSAKDRKKKKKAKVAETEEDLEGFEDEDETDIDIPVEIVGAEYPTVWDLTVLRIFLLPYSVLWYLRECWIERNLTPDEVIMRRNNITQEQLEDYRMKEMRRIEKLKSSTKYKRYKRYIKKHK